MPVSNSAFHYRMDRVDAELQRIERTIRQIQQDWASRKGFYIIAEPGYPNYGDELIAREWLKYLAAFRPEAPVFLDCTRPGPAATILRGIHPNLTVVDTVSRLTFENVYADGDIERGRVADIAAFLRNALDDEGRAARYSAGIEILRNEVSGIHFVGGGYMNGRWTANLARLEVGAWAAEQSLPVIATGEGLMPLEDNAKTYVRGAANGFSKFTVRDEKSKEALDPLQQCDLMPDDCFINGLSGVYSDDDNLPETMVCVQSDFVKDRTALNQHVLNVLESWKVKPTDSIGVVECNPYVDYPIMQVLMDAGYEPRFYPTSYLLRHGFPAKEGQRWLTTRYHPHLLAAARGCIGSFVSVDADYYSVKHNAVLRMGSNWTESVLGENPPEPGRGFDDLSIRTEYARQIRRSASALYGEDMQVLLDD